MGPVLQLKPQCYKDGIREPYPTFMLCHRYSTFEKVLFRTIAAHTLLGSNQTRRLILSQFSAVFSTFVF